MQISLYQKHQFISELKCFKNVCIIHPLSDKGFAFLKKKNKVSLVLFIFIFGASFITGGFMPPWVSQAIAACADPALSETDKPFDPVDVEESPCYSSTYLEKPSSLR